MYPTMSDRRYPSMRYQRQPGRFLRLLAGVLLVLYIVNNPTEAAANAKGLMGWLEAGTESFFSFVDAVSRA